MRILFLIFFFFCELDDLLELELSKTARSLPTRMIQRRKGYRTVLYFRYCLFSLLSNDLFT